MDSTPTRFARAYRCDDRGFTIIESLTAATILLIIAVGVITVLVTTSGWYAKARMRTEASAVANEVMSLILSRNVSEIVYAQGSETWPQYIPAQMTWPTEIGDFSVDTSITLSVVDTSTAGIPMTRVIVTASPVGQSPDTAVAVIRYASGWQEKSAATEEFKVPVKVQIAMTPDGLPLRGVRVQLLDVSTMAEGGRFAVTNDTGLADFGEITEGQYFLTCDPRFGSDIRPLNFPRRVFPTHGGSAKNPIKAVVTYQLPVYRSDSSAVLRVGAYRTVGWTNPTLNAYGTFDWTEPDKPYQPVAGLTVYAKPNLNAGGSGGTFGTVYPLESTLNQQGGVYSGVVNAYGIAVIPIDWTTEPEIGQTWTVWCNTRNPSTGEVTKHELTDYASGSWAKQLDRIDFPVDGAYDKAPQWQGLQGDPAP